jgi:hypothetical protein
MTLASLITAAIFIGIPMILNHQEERRLAAVYTEQDSALPSSVNRAIELKSDTPRIGHYPVRCDSDCLDLMTFGRASSVTRTFPKASGPTDAQATFQNFHLGVGGPDCAGPTFENFCAHATNETIPDDRLILTLETVTRRREMGSDICSTPFGARYIQVSRAGYDGHALYFFPLLRAAEYRLGREWILSSQDGLPTITSSLDANLRRAFVANRSWNGRNYPFR